jgi:hypothetical protein
VPLKTANFPVGEDRFDGQAACAERHKFLIDRNREISMTHESHRELPGHPPEFIRRFFGGPPLAVIGRLVLLSILVGVILAAIGLDPWNILERVWNMGFDAVRWLWRYFLLGAVIVLPIWLLVRLAKAPRGL